MNTTTRNSIILAGILLIEAIILKIAKSMRLWIYIALPITAGFALIEILKPRPKENKRNLK